MDAIDDRRFLDHPQVHPCGVAQLAMQDLDRHAMRQQYVGGFEHLAHPAGTDLLHDSIRPDERARAKRDVVRRHGGRTLHGPRHA
jgi:hypothetical protein